MDMHDDVVGWKRWLIAVGAGLALFMFLFVMCWVGGDILGELFKDSSLKANFSLSIGGQK